MLTRADGGNPAVDGVVAALDRSARRLHDPAAGLVSGAGAAAVVPVRALAVPVGP